MMMMNDDDDDDDDDAHRKLVQFDSGKLSTLSVLLRGLKRGGHKCLIFTQMSKMLDILEVFLNLNCHTYVRLDGSTGVERRQKLMDRLLLI
jgi:SNF2 family DNA or RNA helicase